MAELFSWRGLDAVMAEEMTVLPGMDELGNLLWIADHVESGDVRRDRRRRGADGRDAAPAVAARGEPLVGRADRPDRAPGQPDRPAGARADDRRADAPRRGVRGGRAPARPARPRPSPARGSRAVVDPAGAEPREARRSSRRSARSRTSTCSATRATWSSATGSCPRDAATATSPAAPDAAATTCPRSIAQFAPVPVRTVPFFDREMVGIERPARDRPRRSSARTIRPSSSIAAGRTRSGPKAAATSSRWPCRSPSREDVGLSRDGDELVISGRLLAPHARPAAGPGGRADDRCEDGRRHPADRVLDRDARQHRLEVGDDERATVHAAQGPVGRHAGRRSGARRRSAGRARGTPGAARRRRPADGARPRPDGPRSAARGGRHFRNAGREQLLGIRSIVDFWIRRIELAEEHADGPAGQGSDAAATRGRIEID